MARRISPCLVSEWQGELLARKIAEGINTATEAIASFARELQKARDIEDNNSHNSQQAAIGQKPVDKVMVADVEKTIIDEVERMVKDETD